MKTKVCKDCLEEKATSEFYKRKDFKDGLYTRCKKCHCKVTNENAKGWYRRNKESRKEYNAKYWEENKLTYREDARVRAKQWYQENRAKAIASARAREMNQHKATPAWLTEEQLRDIQLVYDHAKDCQSVTGEPYEVDHIIPLRGENICGLHVSWNLQVLPKDVNRAKSNKYDPDLYSPRFEGAA